MSKDIDNESCSADRAEFERGLLRTGIPVTKVEGGKEYYSQIAQLAWEGYKARVAPHKTTNNRPGEQSWAW